MTTVHSIADPCDPEVSPTNNRHLTVSYASRYLGITPAFPPSLHEKRQCFGAAGFLATLVPRWM